MLPTLFMHGGKIPPQGHPTQTIQALGCPLPFIATGWSCSLACAVWGAQSGPPSPVQLLGCWIHPAGAGAGGGALAAGRGCLVLQRGGGAWGQAAHVSPPAARGVGPVGGQRCQPSLSQAVEAPAQPDTPKTRVPVPTLKQPGCCPALPRVALPQPLTLFLLQHRHQLPHLPLSLLHPNPPLLIPPQTPIPPCPAAGTDPSLLIPTHQVTGGCPLPAQCPVRAIPAWLSGDPALWGGKCS